MDQEVAWDTFDNFLAASRELGIKDELVSKVQTALNNLVRDRGSRGDNVVDNPRDQSENSNCNN